MLQPNTSMGYADVALTADDLNRIDRAIARGEKRVTFANRTVEYRDMAELIRARDKIAEEIAAADTSNPTRRQRMRPLRSVGF